MYRHFADKYELFRRVFFSLVVDIGAELALRDNPAHIFTLIGQMQSGLSSKMASIWADPEPGRSFHGYAGYQAQAGFERPEPVAMVARYIAAEQRLGRARPDVDPVQATAAAVAIPFASGMGKALWSTFGPGPGVQRAEDFPIPAGVTRHSRCATPSP